MKNYLFTAFFFALPGIVMAQFTIEDTAMMSMAINQFRSDIHAKYWLVNKTYDRDYRERSDFADSALKSFAFNKKVPATSRMEIFAAAKHFKNTELPPFENALMIEVDSKEIDLLCGIYSVTAESTTDVNTADKKKPKTREEAANETLSFYKDYYRLAEIKALEVSEPFYDSLRTNAIVILTEYKHLVANTYLLLFKKEHELWKLTDSLKALSFKF